jgi:hypothetical protein
MVVAQGSGNNPRNMMNDTSRLGKAWTEDELVVVLDLYFNGHLTSL